MVLDDPTTNIGVQPARSGTAGVQESLGAHRAGAPTAGGAICDD